MLIEAHIDSAPVIERTRFESWRGIRGLLTQRPFLGPDHRMAAADDLDFCFTVLWLSIHRIQESHAMLGYRLWWVSQEDLASCM